MRFFAAGLVGVLACHCAGASPKIVGIGIAKSNSHVYVWFDDGVFSSGNSSYFEKYGHPKPYQLPPGKQTSDIVAMSIAKNDRVYTWYRDQTVSVGTTARLAAYQAPIPVTLPNGETMDGVKGIGIAGSNDHVYAWFADGKVYEGTSTHFDSYHRSGSYKVAAGFQPADIVEMDIAPNDWVYVWYRQGFLSAGKSTLLDSYYSIAGWIGSTTVHHFLAPLPSSVIPPMRNVNPAVLRGLGDGGGISSSIAGKISGRRPFKEGVTPYDGSTGPAGAVVTPLNTTTGDVDPMVAAGSQYLLLSGTGSLTFADRSGAPLPATTGLKTQWWSSEFFSGVLNQLNGQLGFSQPCNSSAFPAEAGNGTGFCLYDVYDTRVYFAPDTRRFYVIAHMRNAIQYNLDPGATWKDKKPGACGYWGKAGDPTRHLLFSTAECAMGRHYVAIAVSVDEDPRHGFHQYAITGPIIDSDFPWIAVTGNRVLIGYWGDPPLQPPASLQPQPIARVLERSAMEAGADRVGFFDLYPDDLKGMAEVLPPWHAGDTLGMALLLGVDSDIHIFAMPNSGDPWTPPAIQHTTLSVDDPPSTLWSTYRDHRLYMVGNSAVESNASGARWSVRVMRVLLTKANDGSLALHDRPEAGFLNWMFGRNAPGDPAGARVSYEKPSMAVNQAGDMLFGYMRRGFAGGDVPVEARVTLWKMGETAPRRSQLLEKGTGSCGGKIDYTSTAVDPADAKGFFVTLPFCKDGAYQTEVGKIQP